jgi:putative ABC transport system ATP-binding protein
MIALDAVARVFDVGGERVAALDGVSLGIEPGEYVSVMGPSGSGKSTLLNVLGLLDRPTDGIYRLNGRDVTRLSDAEAATVRREAVGFVFQAFHLVPRLSAVQNIELPMLLAGIAPAERNLRVERALSGFGLADRARHRPAELSGGQRQRVAIARATVMQPALLLADEPTGNLDQATGREVLALLEQLNAAGMTLVMVTHDADIGARARRRIRMVDGRIVGDESRASQAAEPGTGA